MPPRFAVALLAVALLLPAAARAGQPPAAELDAPAFVALLEHLADQVRATDSAAAAAALAHDLPAAWTVRAGDERLTVPAAPIVDALTATSTPESSWPDIRAAAVARIDALREEASPLARAGAPPPPHLRGALADVLAAPEFRGRQRYAGLLAFVDRVRRWLRSWLPDVRPGTAAVAPILRYATWAIAAVAFVLLAWLTWRVLRGASRDTAARPAAGARRRAGRRRGRGRRAPAPPPRRETPARPSAAPTTRSCTASTKTAPGRSRRPARRASTCGCCRPPIAASRRCRSSRGCSKARGTAAPSPPSTTRRPPCATSEDLGCDAQADPAI